MRNLEASAGYVVVVAALLACKGGQKDDKKPAEKTSAAKECAKLKAKVTTRTIEHEHHAQPFEVKECLVTAENPGDTGAHVFETAKSSECTSLRIKVCSAAQAEVIGEGDEKKTDHACYDYCRTSKTFVRRWKR